MSSTTISRSSWIFGLIRASSACTSSVSSSSAPRPWASAQGADRHAGPRDGPAPVPAVWVRGRVSRRRQPARPLEVVGSPRRAAGRRRACTRLEGIVRAEIVSLEHDAATGRFRRGSGLARLLRGRAARAPLREEQRRPSAGRWWDMRAATRARASDRRSISAKASASGRARPQCTVVGRDAAELGR